MDQQCIRTVIYLTRYTHAYASHAYGTYSRPFFAKFSLIIRVLHTSKFIQAPTMSEHGINMGGADEWVHM